MKAFDTDRSLRRFQIAGYASFLIMAGVFGGWAALTQINGAVIAGATVIAESNTKRIQTKDGGIIREILVKDGDRVQAGQPLVVLDDTDTRAELEIIDALLAEALAKRARLEAERDQQAGVTYPVDLLFRKDEPKIASLMAGQDKLHVARTAAVQGKVDQLSQQTGQISEQVDGIKAQIKSKEDQIRLIKEELTGLLELRAKGLVAVSRVGAMQREKARLEGERGELLGQKASAESKISEVKLQILQVREETLSQALNDLRETEGRIAELSERKLAAASRLDRTTVKSPITGDVYQLAVHTLGGVVGPAEALMLIVPEGDNLVLQAQVTPQNIEQITKGQTARVRFPAFSSRLTPEIEARVTSVAADVSRTDQNSPPFYLVRLQIEAGEIDKLGENKLKPGMPAEAHIQTYARSPLSYFVKPLLDQIAHTWRER